MRDISVRRLAFVVVFSEVQPCHLAQSATPWQKKHHPYGWLSFKVCVCVCVCVCVVFSRTVATVNIKCGSMGDYRYSKTLETFLKAFSGWLLADPVVCIN